jgi:hypothetical protein
VVVVNVEGVVFGRYYVGMQDFDGVDARDGDKVEGRCPCPDPCLASASSLAAVGCWGSTDVDDDGDAVRKREIRAEFPFYDVEILLMRIAPSSNALTIDSGASLGCSGGRQGPRSDLARSGGVCQEGKQNLSFELAQPR